MPSLQLAAEERAKGALTRDSDLSQADFASALQQIEADLPKVWRLVASIRAADVEIVVRAERKRGPAMTVGPNRIVISSAFFRPGLPRFPEDRLVVVLLHEFGHVLFTREVSKSARNPVKQEVVAFSYSLEMTRKMAMAGDPGPLKEALQNLQQRATSGRPADPHTIALQQIIAGPLWHECGVTLSGLAPKS